MTTQATNLTSPAKKIEEALRALIAAAPEAQRNALAQAIEDYAEQRGRTFQKITSKGGLLGTLFDTIIEETEAMPTPMGF